MSRTSSTSMDFKWVVPLILQLEIIMAQWRNPDTNHFRLFLNDDESLVIPKNPTELKILSTVAYGDKIYPTFPKINKKPPKYLKLSPVLTKLKPSFDLVVDEKKCCVDKWALDHHGEISLEELIRPVSLPSYQPPHSQRFENFEDIKPVTEHIEGDIKYDFRTKTHSIR